ncbi:hypothetical protein N7455_010960 [Penicillium solitum]|uniref:uncharacterized protein n=1 Tax=Penicillium solitum TaxID=60172 RepID=UPI0032C43B64|nr:hypothetical protein N7455_010960 [Penicillium solitum]
MPDNREDIIVQAEPGAPWVSTKKLLHVALNSEPPTSLYHTLTATCSVALMCLAPSIFTSQDYISDHLWKANIN